MMKSIISISLHIAALLWCIIGVLKLCKGDDGMLSLVLAVLFLIYARQHDDK